MHGGDPALAAQTMAVQGPLARTVGDLRLALDAMSGPDPRDPTYAPTPAIGPAPARPIRVGLVRDPGIVPAAPTVAAALDAAAAWLEDAGYRVEEIEMPALRDSWALWLLLAFEDFRPVLPLVAQMGDEGIKRAAELYYQVAAEVHGASPDFDDYIRGHARRGTLGRAFGEKLAEFPLILMPVSAEAAFTWGDDTTDLDRTRQLFRAQWPMLSLATVGFPGIAVPTGIVDGMPTGVQILGPRFREDLLLDAAEVLEARCGRLGPIDPAR